jgi:hypothetical protein
MAGVIDVKDGEVRQEKVFKSIRWAKNILKGAADAESQIETERISRFNPQWDDACDRRRDPLEGKLREIIERLEEIV